ncbi:glycine--tRNA ligase subunit beta, partial [bacterium]|nr:glycine--tRNA ligase subunit beta [bacterium]
QELYLQSLEALGINPREHDIRFVEDNWESPALGAWGLGWEVWLDGQEITQFTYFQQAGGLELNPVSVEITYGVERIVLALQGKNSAWEIDWMPGLTYADMIFNEEVEYCRYYFDIADVDALKSVYDTYEREMGRSLEGDSIISAYDYVLKCSHLFNVLDTRGAIGVTERAVYFRRMRDMTRTVAKAYHDKRESLGFPLLKMQEFWNVDRTDVLPSLPKAPTEPADVLLEIGVEELPADDVDAVIAHLSKAAPALFEQARLSHQGIETMVTPRRIVLYAKQIAPRQPDQEDVVKGPPAARAFDAEGNPTQAAIGFAKGKGLDVSALKRETIDGGEYVTAFVKTDGKPATTVLMELLPQFITGIKFAKTMRWNETNVTFSRPIRWIVSLWGSTFLPFDYAGLTSYRTTRGLRPFGSPELNVKSPTDYFRLMQEQGIILDREKRRAAIIQQITALAQEVGGTIPDDAGLLDEVVNLVEAPTALRGTFEARDLELPRDVLVTVMRKHQRYFPVQDANGQLMAYFIAVRNGDAQHLDKVIHGNEHVLRARFSDARYFYTQDLKKKLAEGLPRLETLTFQEKLGSMRDKNDRVALLIAPLGQLLKIAKADIQIAQQGAQLAKADLAKQMVVEMTSLQGIMGREYALREGIAPEVAQVIFEHWLPRGAGDQLPQSAAGRLVALADKLDSLTGLYAAGLAPKANSDPYGLLAGGVGRSFRSSFTAKWT